MAQLAEHVIGNDEVPGPNPGSSSNFVPGYGINQKTLDLQGFFGCDRHALFSAVSDVWEPAVLFVPSGMACNLLKSFFLEKLKYGFVEGIRIL